MDPHRWRESVAVREHVRGNFKHYAVHCSITITFVAFLSNQHNLRKFYSDSQYYFNLHYSV